MKWIDLTGQRFGMLVAVEKVGTRCRAALWRCRCDCGTEKDIRSSSLMEGRSKSCGCSSIQMMKANLIRHGHWAGGKASSEYAAWEKARHRCHNPRSHAFKDYGGRGITMCDRWRFGEGALTGFECFLADMGLKPSGAHSLDRAENDKGYDRDNCRWATAKEQNRNRRGNRIINFFGEEMTITELAEWADIDRGLLISRLNRGWSYGRALSSPP